MADRAERGAARAVLRDAQSRAVAPLSLPLAAVHGARFLECLGREDAGVERLELWGPGAADGEQRSAGVGAAKQPAQDLPARYAHQNARCVRCAVPLIPGYSAVHRTIPRRRSSSRAKTTVTLCTHCGAKQAHVRADAARIAFPSTRQRRAVRAEILQGKVRAPVPTAEAKRAPAPAEPERPAERPAAAVPAAPEIPAAPAPAVSPLEERARQLKAKRKQERAGPGPTAEAASAPAPVAPSAAPRRPPTAHQDTKAGLRALLAQRQQSGRPAPGGQKPGRRGLADLLDGL